MMYTPKGRHALVTLLLIASCHGNDRSGQRYDPTIPSLPRHLTPPWEYILREIVLKSVTPSDGNALHTRPLDVSLYGGPIAAHSNDDMNVVLSRGNVYRLLNDHWMLCQDGCDDCEPCAAQRNPLFKWILRRVEPPVSDPPRHDLQLTITPQADDHLRAGNLWLNSYVYVTSQGKRASPDAPINGTTQREDNEREDSLSNLENSFSAQHHRSKDHGRLTERDSSVRGDEIPHEEVGSRAAVVPGNASSTEKTAGKADSSEQKRRFGNMRRQRPTAEKLAEEASQLMPTLILGTDQRGQRHLVHVVPADQLSIAASHPAYSSSPISSHFTGQPTTAFTDNAIPRRQTYQQIFRRVFDSLNTHRRSIENFLESSATSNVDGQRIRSRTDNMEAAGFTWSNHDAGRNTGANLRPLLPNGSPLPFFYMEDEDGSGGYQQYRRRHDGDTKRDGNDRSSSEYRDRNRAKALRGRSRAIFDWSRERRKVRVKPYFVDDARINTSSILLQNSVNSSVNSVPRSGFGNIFVINSAGQIDFNDTFVVDRANNDSVELNAITKIRENGRLFDSDRLKSGDANREYEASHHPFGVIVTTELPVIRSEHETLNRTTTLQITTVKNAR